MHFQIRIQNGFHVYEDSGAFREVMQRLRRACPSGFIIEAVLPKFSPSSAVSPAIRVPQGCGK